MEALRLVLFSLAFLCAGLVVAEDVVVDLNVTTISTEGPTKQSTVTERHTTAHDTTIHPTTATPTHAVTTGASPTSTAKPTPQNVWTVENNGTYCILLQATFTMTFSYNGSDHKIVTNKTTIHKPPNSDVKSTGNCLSNVNQSISLSFLKDWVLTLNFTHGNNSASYSVTHFELQYNLTQANFSDLPSNLTESVTESYKVDKKFETSKAGYSCMANQTLYTRAAGGEMALIRIDVQELKLEAFQQKHKAEFSDNYVRCSQDEISNLVPIIVGACLGGLILIVLVAYLIGRRRSRRGYESV